MHQTQRAGSNSNREGISRPSQGPKEQIQKSSTEYNPDCWQGYDDLQTDIVSALVTNRDYS